MDEMTYPQLKQECARLGLSAKGTKESLSERLDQFVNGNEALKVFVAETDNADISPDEIVTEAKEENGQILADNELDLARLKHESDWESLKRKLDLIFVGRVQYFLQTNAPGNYSVVFKGTARQSECINLTAGEKTILHMAQRFVAPALVAPSTGGDTPEMAKKRFERANPSL